MCVTFLSIDISCIMRTQRQQCGLFCVISILVFSSHLHFSSLNPLVRLAVNSEAETESWLQHAEWIPQSRGGLVMVKDNDIYYR